jgi:hypothetical protein
MKGLAQIFFYFKLIISVDHIYSINELGAYIEVSSQKEDYGMKKTLWVWLLIFALVVTACSSATETTEPKAEDSEVASDEVAQAEADKKAAEEAAAKAQAELDAAKAAEEQAKADA